MKVIVYKVVILTKCSGDTGSEAVGLTVVFEVSSVPSMI
jgi:hypothetical protein